MKYLIALSLLLIPAAHAAGVNSLFGTSRFTPNTPHTVSGPLVQLTTAGGSTLSFQQGSKFSIDDTGTITLTQGNLRVGPAGSEPLTVNLPQGPATIAPLTALTVTAQPGQTTGRIYQGNLSTTGRTFTTGEGFILTQSGAHGTFTPAPAQAPALTTLASIEPASGPTSQQTAPTTPDHQPVTTPNSLLLPTQPATTPAPQEPISEQPAPENPITEQPTPEQPVVTEPKPETPAVEEPSPDQPVTDDPQLPVTENPTPEEPTLPEIPVVEEPVVETPVPEVPTAIQRSNLLAAYTENLGLPMPTGATLPGLFTLNEFSDGTQQLTEMQTRSFRTTTSLNIGSALNLESTSNGSTAGLGRWVGGDLTTVATNAEPSSIQHTMPTDTETPTPNSLHYIWGEKATATPTSGHVEYSLFAATQPTYVTQPGAPALSSAGATFTGNLSIDFAPGFSGVAGSYHLNGTVTMPQTTQTETGPTTTQTAYTISTPTQGVPLTSNFTNTGTLNVTAPQDAIACPTGTCTGTINAAGFGAGMQTAGALYTINPTAPVGVTGAALFTANP